MATILLYESTPKTGTNLVRRDNATDAIVETILILDFSLLACTARSLVKVDAYNKVR